MVNYHAILPEPLAAMPIPAELKRFRIPFLVATFFENSTCQLLRQTWVDDSEDFFIQFTYINIRSACRLIASPARSHIAASLIYVLEGNLTVREKESGNPLPRMKGDFYLRRLQTSKSNFTLDFAQPGTCQIIYVSLSEKKLAALRQAEPIFNNKNILNAREIRKAGAWIKSRILEMQQRRESSKDAMDRYLIRRTQRLFDSFIHLYDSNSIRWSKLNPKERMDHLQLYIQNNLGANLRLGTLAKMLLMSEGGFRAFFHRESGMSLTSYVKKARVQATCRKLLAYPEKTLLEIAEETGYESTSGLIRAFKDIMHCRPDDFRQKQRNPPK